MKKLISSLLLMATLVGSSSYAADARGDRVITIAPVFSQLLMISSPANFVPVLEHTAGEHYLRESVPKGESVGRWSQMQIIIGEKGYALNPQMSPDRLALFGAQQFRGACPSSFSAREISREPVDGHAASVTVLSCGASPTTGGKTSETILYAIIKGDVDYYTIQWAEHGNPSSAPIEIDMAKWASRFKDLMPIRLCPIKQGEAAPYPSCSNRR